MKEDFITKSFKLHKEKDKDLIEILKTLSSHRIQNEKVIEALRKHLDLELREDKLFKELKRLENKINDLEFVEVSSPQQLPKQINNISIIERPTISLKDAMSNYLDDDSDEAIDLF